MPEAIAEAEDFFLPLQVGCGLKCGAVAAVYEAIFFWRIMAMILLLF